MPSPKILSRLCSYCDKWYPTAVNEKLLFCSRKCYANWQSENMRGEKANGFKGDRVSYAGIHKWVYRNFKKLDSCEKCGVKNVRFEWANLSHHYKRLREDWMFLCVPCHRAQDAFRRTRYYEGSRWNKIFKQRGLNGER